jgi:type III pantothenate kinase
VKRAFVTLDVGNSSCKLCLWALGERGALELRERWRHALDDELIAALSDHLSRLDADGAALSCVAAKPVEQRVGEALERRFGERAQRAPSCGLAIECREPEAVGSDRLFAARGAFEVAGRSAVVLDAGTALTVDALRVEDGQASFCGGAIAPGPVLLARALSAGTARLPLVDLAPGAAAVGLDTRGAIVSGVVHGFRGAARELVLRVREEARLGAAPLVATGGASDLLFDPPLFDAHTTQREPDLVHLGLLCALLDDGARAARHGLRR